MGQFKLETVYRTLFESAAEGLLVVDLKGKVLLANKRCSELFGYEKDELLGKPVELLMPSELRKVHESHRNVYNAQPVQRSMGEGLDLTAQRKDGTTFPVEISLNHFESDEGHLVMALITDISKRKVAEIELAQLNAELERRVAQRARELKESQRLYSLIARNFPNGTINVFDRSLNYVFAEGRELFRMGVTSEQLVGTNYLDRLDQEIAPLIRSQLERVFEGHDVSFEVNHGGNRYELNCVGLISPTGEIPQILVVEHDITRQKKAEEDIRNALSKERELNELKSRFVSIASHEFRTPLSTILTSLSLVARYDAPEDVERRNKHLARIKSSVHNLTSILNDFLSLEKLETGIVSCNPTEISLPLIIGEVVEEMQVLAKDEQKISYTHQGEETAFLDGNMIRNIIVNLVSNAIKYSPSGKPILIISAVENGKVTVSVADHGIGIPDTEQVLMFQRFFRAKNAINIQGTGLGLTIVKKYLDIMAGDIWFESRENGGSTFTIVLPQHIQQ